MRFASNAPQRWIFEKRGKTVEVDVTGSLIAGESDLAIRLALDGVAIARVPLHAVQAHLARKTLVEVLEDWKPRSVGFYLYYPSRRRTPPHAQLRDKAASRLRGMFGEAKRPPPIGRLFRMCQSPETGLRSFRSARHLSLGVDLTFATHPAASSQCECQIQNSTRIFHLLVVL
jgi:hypothetical protein